MKDIKERLKSLYSICFDDKKEYVDYFFAKKFRLKNALWISKDGEIISLLTLIPKKLMVREKTFRCPYIVGACTRSDMRGKGLISDLILKSFKIMKNNGVTMCALYPFSHDFYRRHGFVTVNRMKEEIIDYKKSDYTLKTASVKDTDIIHNFYKKRLKDYDLKIIRNKEDFKRKIEETSVTGITKLIYDNDGLCGYVMYDDEEIIEALGEGFEQIEDLRGKRINTPSEEDSEYSMIRIINPVKLLSEIIYPVIDCTARIKIKDNFFSENNMSLEINIKDGKTEIKPSKIYDYTLTAEELALLVFGAYKRENYSPPIDLQSLFPPAKALIFDKY